MRRSRWAQHVLMIESGDEREARDGGALDSFCVPARPADHERSRSVLDGDQDVGGTPPSMQRVSSFGTPSKLYLCRGKHCRGRYPVEFDALARTARKAGVEVECVRCLHVCKGPTAVTVTGAKMRVFKRIRSRKRRADLVALLVGARAEPTPRLARLRVTGKRRRKIMSRLAKACTNIS
jgi:hypothetical protein